MNLTAMNHQPPVSPQRHRLLASSLLITLLLSCYALLIDPWFAARAEHHEQLATISERIDRYQKIIATESTLRAAVTQLEQQAEPLNVGVFKQATSALALAELQRKVKLAAASNGARLMTTQPLNQGAASADQRIAVSVGLQGDLASVHGLLVDLRAASPALLTESLTIVGRGAQRASANRGRSQKSKQREQTLNVTMTLSAYWQPTE